MKAFFIAGLVLLGTTLPQAMSAPTDSPKTPEEIKAEQLVQALGDDRFRVREDAAKQLIKMGRLAKKALLEGKQKPDAEISARCSQILPQALEHDLKVRVESFLADKEGTKEHDLPFWNRYQKIVGKDPAARKFFVEMINANINWVDPCTESAAVAADQYDSRARELFEQLQLVRANARQREIPATEIAMLLLIGADAETSKFMVADPRWILQIVIQPNIQLRNGKAAHLRKLLFAWAEHRNNPGTKAHMVQLIHNQKLKEGVPFAIKVMQMKNENEHVRAQAAMCVGIMGSEANATTFDSLLTETTELGLFQLHKSDGNIQIATNLSDVALAMSLHLAKLQAQDFGFDSLQDNPNVGFSYQSLGFSKESKRIAALIKAAGRKELAASTRAAILTALARYGKKDDVKLLEPFLYDTLVVATTTINGKKFEVQLRDVALSAVVAMSNRERGEYGFEILSKEDKAKLAVSINYYFSSDEKRAAAHKKWKEWFESQQKTKN